MATASAAAILAAYRFGYGATGALAQALDTAATGALLLFAAASQPFAFAWNAFASRR